MSHTIVCPGFAFTGMRGCSPALLVIKPHCRKGFESFFAFAGLVVGHDTALGQLPNC